MPTVRRCAAIDYWAKDITNDRRPRSIKRSHALDVQIDVRVLPGDLEITAP